jgi:hypothetical protein
VIHVSREARAEALKGYTRAFGAYVDLEEDTVFIIDPVFALREPRKAFLDAEHVSKLCKIAITSDIYVGLDEYGVKFPTLCDGPAAILRKLEGLTHFTFALPNEYETIKGRSDDGYVTDNDEDNEDHDSGVEDVDAIAIGPNHTGKEAQLGTPVAGTCA